MDRIIRLPLFENLGPGIFSYGTVVLVEFEAHSLWYEFAYTIAAQSLKEKLKTDFHIFQHPPDDIRQALSRLGVDVDQFEKLGQFRIIDSYTVQAGLGTPSVVKPYDFTTTSLKMSDWMSQMFNVFGSTEESNLIHIDENDSVLANYNTEKELLDFFRRTYTAARGRGFMFIYALLTDVHSQAFYAQFESLADVVVDFSSQEKQGSVDQFARIRIARGSRQYDSKWRGLHVLENGEIQILNEVPPEDASRQPARRLAAIMFTDIVGYTALSQKHESLALEILRLHNQLIRPFFTKYRGTEIKTIGDSFLVEFDSALDAANCAFEIQRFLHDYNISAREDRKISLRIGIHLGDVIQESGDIFGDAVNIASRIQPLSSPEGVCVSQQVFDQIHNKVDYPLQQLEKTQLKNVKFETNVYSFLMPWQRKVRSSRIESNVSESDGR